MTDEELKARFDSLRIQGTKTNKKRTEEDLRARFDYLQSQAQQPATQPIVQQPTATQPTQPTYANHGALAQQGHQNVAQRQANIATNVTKPMTEYMQNGGSININDTASLAQLARERGMSEDEINYLQGRQQASTLPSMQTQYKPLPGSTTPVAIPNSGYDPVKNYDIEYGDEEAQKVLGNVKMNSDDRSASTYVDAKANLEKAQREGNLREIAKNQGIIRNYENIYKSNYNKEWDKLKDANIKSLNEHVQGAASDLNKSYEKLLTSTGDNLKRAYDEYQRDLERYNEAKSRYDEAITYDELINNNPIEDFGRGLGVGATGAVAKGMTYGKLAEDALLEFFGSARNPANINANSLLDYNNENYQVEKYSGAIERAAGDTDVTGEYQNMSPASAFNRLKQLAENNPEYMGLQTLLREISTHSYKGTAEDLAKELDRISREMYQGWKNTHTQAGYDWEQAQQEHNERAYRDNELAKTLTNASITVGEMLPTVAAGFVGQPASMGTLFMSAAGGSADQAINQGATINQGTLYGALSGATEVATEMIGGENVNRLLGMKGQSLLSKVFGDSIKNLHIDSKAAKVALNTLFDVGGEMLEEATSEAINPLLQAITYDPSALPDNVDEYFQNIFEAAIEAIPSTLLMEGMGVGTNVVRVNQVENGIINRINESDLSPIIKNQLANEVHKASRDVKLGLEESDYIEKRTNERYSTLQAQSEQMKQRIPQGYTLPQSTVDILAYTENNRPGLTIAFDNTIKGNGNFIDNGDGTRTITLNPNSKRAVEFVLTHELGHDLKGTAEYTQLQNLLLDYAKGKPNYQKSLNALDKTYRESGANYNLQDEATNDMLGEAIGEQEFYNKLAENPTLFNRVTNELKNLLGNKDTKLKNKIEKLTSNALKQEYRGNQQGTQQSLSEAENGKTLAATHSLSENNLRKLLDLGGIPVPSIAISKPELFSGAKYGEATIYFNKDTINPENKLNETYSRDIYSPRFPTIGYKINKNITRNIQERAENIAKKDGTQYRNPYLGEINLDMYETNLMDFLRDRDGLEGYLKSLKDSYKFRYMFLKETQPDFKEIFDNNGNIDIEETNKRIDETANQEEYEKWLNNLFNGVIEKKGLRNSKNYYTNSGNPRSFEQLHDDYNIYNVVNLMKSQNTTGTENFFMVGFNEIAATAAKKFKSIKDIKNNESMLKNLAESDYLKEIEPISEKLKNIEIEIVDQLDKKGLVSNYFTSMDNVGNAIKDVARKSNQKSKLTPQKVIDTMQKSYIEIDGNMAQRIIDVIYDMKDLPAYYFESKPQRAVGFNEISSILIPNTFSEETKQALRDKGIRYIEYNPKIEGDREAKHKQAAQDVLFSKSNGAWQQFLDDTYGKWNTGTKTNFESLPSNEELQQQERNSVAEDAKAMNLEQVIMTAEKELEDSYRRVTTNKSSKQRTFLGKVSQKASNIINRLLNIDVTGRNHIFEDNDFRHLLKHSNEQAELAKGQMPITMDDIRRIPDILENFDDIIKGTDNKEGQTIRYIKHYNDGTNYLVEIVPDKGNNLKIKTMWKKTATLANSTSAPSLTSKTQGSQVNPTSVNNSIPPSNNSVNQQGNTQFSLSEEEQKEVNDYADKLFEDKTLDENYVTDVYDRLKRVQNYSDFENIKQEVSDYKDKMYKGISGLEDIANLKPEDTKQREMTYKQRKDKNTTNQRKFFENAETSPIIAEQTKNNVNATTYERQGNIETLNEMRDKLDERGNDLVEEWKVKTKNFTAKDVALGAVLIERYQQDGDWASAARTVEKLADMGTEAGRAVQMYSIFQRLSPETMAIYQQKALDQAFEDMKKKKTGKWVEANKDKFRLTAEDTQFIYEQVEKASQAIDEETKQRELSKIENRINEKLPPEAGQSIKALRRIAMLFNPKTQVRNIVGNALIMPVNDVADFVGSLIDKLVSRWSKIRTTSSPNLITKAKGFKKGIRDAITDYKTGTRTTATGSKYEFDIGAKPFNENTGSKVRNAINRKLNGINDLLSAVMSGGDRPFYEAAYKNSLEGQMKANNVSEPTPEMVDIAVNEALQRTWNDDNEYTNFVLGVRRGMNKINVHGFGFGDLIIPFAKTPANLTKAIVEYSPAGFIKSVIDFNDMRKAISRGELTPMQQKKFVSSMSKAIAGTILYTIAGTLARTGAITGSADDDKDVKNFEQNVLGIQPYSVRLGDKTFTYSWANPINAPLAIMADQYKMEKENAKLADRLYDYFKVAGNVLLENSFLQGVQELFGNQDGIMGGIIESIESMPEQLIPTFMSQIASLGDDTQRQTFEYKDEAKTVANRLKNKIPGARNTLEAQVNTFGEEIENQNNVFNAFLNPANVKEAKITDEQKALYDVYQETKDKTIFPMQAPYYVANDFGEKQNLSSKDRYDYQKASGQFVTDVYEDLFKNDRFNKASNEEKVAILHEIATDGNAKGKEAVGASKTATNSNLSRLNERNELLEEANIPLADYYIAWYAKNHKPQGSTYAAKQKAIRDYTDLTPEQEDVLFGIFNIEYKKGSK